ncbi:MAG TPA: cytochrome c [Luteibacter sp.]|uniref:c-type cytochrome n=1 Tax=Luteibacter sp. TaxID=1886636 RepID=UPI002C87E2D2|nr:cytochrome c [Luteibacter sp.]HVI54960.1 cytochrome c [Luteibacter sp.]
MKPILPTLALLAFGAAHAQSNDAAFIAEKDIPHATGEQIFTHICQGCHMSDGKGAVGAGHYPALANNPKLAAATYPVVMVVNGRGAMPSFGSGLSDAQIADVVNYVRTHFGNAYTDTLKPEDVTSFHPAKPPEEGM